MAVNRILFYRSSRGICPAKEFLDSISDQDAQRVAWLFKLFNEVDRIPETYLKKLRDTDEIWEARIQTAGKSIRLLGFFDTNATFVVTHGFTKKTQGTPQREIETAERRKYDYYKRRENNG
jgi:phage-related protein